MLCKTVPRRDGHTVATWQHCEIKVTGLRGQRKQHRLVQGHQSYGENNPFWPPHVASAPLCVAQGVEATWCVAEVGSAGLPQREQRITVLAMSTAVRAVSLPLNDATQGLFSTSVSFIHPPSNYGLPSRPPPFRQSASQIHQHRGLPLHLRRSAAVFLSSTTSADMSDAPTTQTDQKPSTTPNAWPP